jgi:hypothetical protein
MFGTVDLQPFQLKSSGFQIICPELQEVSEFKHTTVAESNAFIHFNGPVNEAGIFAMAPAQPWNSEHDQRIIVTEVSKFASKDSLVILRGFTRGSLAKNDDFTGRYSWCQFQPSLSDTTARTRLVPKRRKDTNIILLV